MAEPEVNETGKPKEDPNLRFKVFAKDGTLLYQTNQDELDDCFYSIISIMSWTKTFPVGNKLKLTFNTITEDAKMELLRSIKLWSEENSSSNTMFEQQLNRYNLANYLTYIEMGKETINLREKKLEDRINFFGTQAESALQLYGTYHYVFLEVIRLALLDQVSLKNS